MLDLKNKKKKKKRVRNAQVTKQYRSRGGTDRITETKKENAYIQRFCCVVPSSSSTKVLAFLCFRPHHFSHPISQQICYASGLQWKIHYCSFYSVISKNRNLYLRALPHARRYSACIGYHILLPFVWVFGLRLVSALALRVVCDIKSDARMCFGVMSSDWVCSESVPIYIF